MSKPYILLLEDDRWLADSYAVSIESADHEVVVTDSAQSAIDIVDEYGAPRALVADVMLAGGTVFSLLNEMGSYEDTKHIPVILNTSVDVGQFHQQYLDSYGVIGVLDKAKSTPNKLIEMIKICLVSRDGMVAR